MRETKMPKKKTVPKPKKPQARPAAVARKKVAPRKSMNRSAPSPAKEMTEAEWRRCPDPTLLLQQVRGKVSDRKRRLFACGCCRRIWSRLTDEFHFCRQAVEVAERFADGLATESEREDYWFAVNEEDREEVVDEAYVAACRAISLDNEEDGDFASATARCAVLAVPRPDRERAAQCRLARCVFGNPFRPVTFDPAWITATVQSLAAAIYEERAFDRMPILGDALEDAGCDHAEVLAHCRKDKGHARGCWVVDAVLGKE